MSKLDPYDAVYHLVVENIEPSEWKRRWGILCDRVRGIASGNHIRVAQGDHIFVFMDEKNNQARMYGFWPTAFDEDHLLKQLSEVHGMQYYDVIPFALWNNATQEQYVDLSEFILVNEWIEELFPTDALVLWNRPPPTGRLLTILKTAWYFYKKGELLSALRSA